MLVFRHPRPAITERTNNIVLRHRGRRLRRNIPSFTLLRSVIELQPYNYLKLNIVVQFVIKHLQNGKNVCSLTQPVFSEKTVGLSGLVGSVRKADWKTGLNKGFRTNHRCRVMFTYEAQSGVALSYKSHCASENTLFCNFSRFCTFNQPDILKICNYL